MDRPGARTITRRVLLLALAWMVTLGGAFLGGAYAYRGRARIRALLGGGGETSVVQTNLHNVRMRQIVVPAEGRDGGIAPLGAGLLMASRTGRLWVVDSTAALHELQLRVPLNQAEFEADPFNEHTVSRELFGVKDLLVDEEVDGRLRIFASHNHWYADRDCYVVRVSSLETTSSALMTLGQDAAWTTRFETTPCRPLTEHPNGRDRNPSLGAGGRMVLLDENTLLVTFGALGPESLVGAQLAQERDNSYGKTIRVDLTSGASRIYTLGHRNPQGLARSSDGRIWLTEHGARGGDELNELVDGANYGYPVVSYGTAYESMTWPTNPVQGRHEGYAKPMFAWTPGVGISQAHVVEGSGFSTWRGDVLATSLNGGTIFRVRIEEGRVIFVEPIPIGHRIRDITETRDGSIVLKTDDDLLVYLTALETVDPAQLTPVERGAALASLCLGCHTLGQAGANAIGPRLWGVVGREVGSVEGYTYSDALRRAGGRWTPDRLTAYMAAPDSFAPGTTMSTMPAFSERDLADLVAYLETLR